MTLVALALLQALADGDVGRVALLGDFPLLPKRKNATRRPVTPQAALTANRTPSSTASLMAHPGSYQYESAVQLWSQKHCILVLPWPPGDCNWRTCTSQLAEGTRRSGPSSRQNLPEP